MKGRDIKLPPTPYEEDYRVPQRFKDLNSLDAYFGLKLKQVYVVRDGNFVRAEFYALRKRLKEAERLRALINRPEFTFKLYDGHGWERVLGPTWYLRPHWTHFFGPRLNQTRIDQHF